MVLVLSLFAGVMCRQAAFADATTEQRLHDGLEAMAGSPYPTSKSYKDDLAFALFFRSQLPGKTSAQRQVDIDAANALITEYDDWYLDPETYRAAAFSALGGAPSFTDTNGDGLVNKDDVPALSVERWSQGARQGVRRNVATGNTQTLSSGHLWRNTYGVKVELPTLLCKAYLRYYDLLTQDSRDRIEAQAVNFAYYRSQIVSDPTNPQNNLNNASLSVWLIEGSENIDMTRFKTPLVLATRVLREARNRGSDEFVDGISKFVLYDGSDVDVHHNAWVVYFKELVKQRAREGLVCEIDHPSTYGESTMTAFYDIHDDGGSTVLTKMVGDLLNVFWLQAAQEFYPSTGIRGGLAATRAYGWQSTLGGNFWGRPILYAYNWTDFTNPEDNHPSDEPILTMVTPYTSSYRPPDDLRLLARDENRQPHSSISRHFGRGNIQNDGNAVYSVVFDPGNNSSIVRSVYWTPYFTISGLSFDPSLSYLELLRQTRQIGVGFPTSAKDRILVMGDSNGAAADRPRLPDGSVNIPKEHSNYGDNLTSAAINSAHKEDALVVARDPNATPHYSTTVAPGVTVFVSANVWNSRSPDGEYFDATEGIWKGGHWFFSQVGNAYAAVRIANAGYDGVEFRYGTNNTGDLIGVFLKLRDKWSPVVLQMADTTEYPTLSIFKSQIKARSLTFSSNKLTYQSKPTLSAPLTGNKFEYWSGSNAVTLPRITGTTGAAETIALNPEETYASPFVSGVHGQDAVQFSYSGTIHEFNCAHFLRDDFESGMPDNWTFTPAGGGTIVSGGLKAYVTTGGLGCVKTFPAQSGHVVVEWKMTHHAGLENRFYIRSSTTKNSVALRRNSSGALQVHTSGGGENAFVNIPSVTLTSGTTYKMTAVIDTVGQTYSLHINDSALPVFTGLFDNMASTDVARVDFQLNNNGSGVKHAVFDDVIIR